MENENTYCVYKHTNKVNGKVYIGQTCQIPKRRWGNGKGYLECTHFYNAICKYGWESFTHEILYNNLSKSEADFLEKAIIEKENSRNPEFGYNIKEGGSTGKLAEETKKKISESEKGEKCFWYGKKLPEEVKKKISESHKGKPAFWKGKKMPDSAVKKMVESHTGEKNHRAVGVMCIELKKSWNCISVCGRELGIERSHISSVCKGDRKTAGGYHFEYTSKKEE